MVETFAAHTSFKGFRVDTGGIRAELIEVGGVVARLEVADRNGAMGNVLLGCSALGDYLGPHPHFNCLVGRYANRMTNARFALDGNEYALDANVPPHHLHGGRAGFGVRRWHGEATADDEASADGVTFRLRSADGDGGYPGNLDVEARYRFHGNRMSLDFEAVADAPTPVSLTFHPYFNLTAEPSATVADHEVAIDAGAFLPVSEALTQLGEIRSVAGTPFDLRKPRRLADVFDTADAQMALADGGFDHTFAIAGSGLRRAAVVHDPGSGRELTVSTDQPGMQFYTANTLHTAPGHGGRYPRRGALCLETQQFPDAPNQPAYPNAILRPGKVFRARTEFAFSVR